MKYRVTFFPPNNSYKAREYIAEKVTYEPRYVVIWSNKKRITLYGAVTVEEI